MFAAGFILAFLVFILAIALLNLSSERIGRGDDESGEGTTNDSQESGTSNSEALGSSSSGNSNTTQDAASDASHLADTNQSRKQLGDSSELMPSTNSATVTEPAAATDEAATTRTTRNFFTLDSNRSLSLSEAADEPATGVRAGIQDSLSGRQRGSKGELLRTGGGTSATEGAVKLGLEWLAKNQQSNGLWSLSGPYDDGGMEENVAAATAMALLAFQGAGHTHKGDPKDPYTAVVARGSAALVEHIRTEGEKYRNAGIHGGYTQALCTIALCELYGMTHDAKLRKPVQNAVDYCIEAQSTEGGWRYIPRQDSDTSVTGWFVLALQSAQMAGLKVPNETLARVGIYLDSAGNDDGTRYGYQQGTVATRSMTAEALLCRQYLGWKQDDPRLIDGADYLSDELPSWDTPNVYYWYYATQVLHHLGGRRWSLWNEVMRETLPSEQITDGPERGSWRPRGDIHAHAGGRLYVTCMCLYMLEVYYRHLPIYQASSVGASN
ncbi:prenyltransferase/squalene oxidase repeat-containing protein [Lacipirellula sp.]|uniref:prenyltransferase/squalene oxidase repeat-containing protein n=1 Tax=Lacipirellula sp. TaxID=2691419 RepID=UPI003D0F9F70